MSPAAFDASHMVFILEAALVAISRTNAAVASHFHLTSLSNTAQKVVAKTVNRTLQEAAAQAALDIQHGLFHGRRILEELDAPMCHAGRP